MTAILGNVLADRSAGFIATDTRATSPCRTGYWDCGGKIVATPHGWACTSGAYGPPLDAVLLGLRDSPRMPDLTPAQRLIGVMFMTLHGKGFPTEPTDRKKDATTAVIEADQSGVYLFSFTNAAGVLANSIALLPGGGLTEWSDERLEESRRRSHFFMDLMKVAREDLLGRICIAARCFSTASEDSRSISNDLNVAYIYPTPDGPRRGFLHGLAAEIADTNPRDILDRFGAPEPRQTPTEIIRSGEAAFSLWDASDDKRQSTAVDVSLDITGSQILVDPLTKEITTALVPATGYKTKSDFAVNNGAATTSFGINRHNDEQMARDSSGARSFSVAFDAIPQMRAFIQAAQVYKASDSGSDQRLDVRATAVTVSTYSPRAKLVKGGSSATKTNLWATSLNGGTAASRTISTNNAAIYCDLADANGVLTTYVARFDVDTSAMDPANTMYVSLYKNNGTSSTSWTLVASASYTPGQTLSNETLQFSDVMTLDYDVRIVITFQTTHPPLGSITAYDVVYQQVTVGTETDATANGTDGVIFQAMEAP